MLSLIFSTQDDEPTYSYPLTLQLEPINFGNRNPARYGEIRSPSIIECALSPWTACAVFLRDPYSAESPMPPPFRQGVSPSRRLPEQLCSFHSLWIGRILRTRRCPGYDLEFNTSPNFGSATMAPVGEPKPLRLHDHAGSARAGKLFLACARTARRRRRSFGRLGARSR
jgi:hypothetical protein